VVGPGELADQAWAVLAPLLPGQPALGWAVADHGRTITGICGGCALARLARPA
jgi:hypothetical protein